MSSIKNINKDIHISFDLDGTIVDSLYLMEEAWIFTTKKLSLNVRFNEYKKYIGTPFRDIINSLNLSCDYNEIYDLYFGYIKDHQNKIKLFPEVEYIIDYLESRGIEWSIITSKPRLRAISILNLFSINPKYLICPEDVCKGKPNNDSINLLKDMAKISKNTKIFYVGDMLTDLKFSVESNIEYIHVSTGIGKCLDNRILNRFYRIDSISEIKHILDYEY